MGYVEKIRRHGLAGSLRIGQEMLRRKTAPLHWRLWKAPAYRNPTDDELARIERDLAGLGVEVHDYSPSPEAFRAFMAGDWFPPDYHGGRDGGVWHEKLLEHWIASQMLGLEDFGRDDVYVDVAACGSPWARSLRERRRLQAFAIDLAVQPEFSALPYYREEDATATSFADASVGGASLHCAYEMFEGDSDTRFIREAARILRPGGRIVIVPLYMHTHHCTYSTPEYWGKGRGDPGATEYLQRAYFGVPASRKYDAPALKRRVLDPATSCGLRYTLHALRDKARFGPGIYCHFILEIVK